MKFLRHPEYNIILERVLKAVEILNSSDQDKIDEFKENVLSKKNDTSEYYKALDSYVKRL